MKILIIIYANIPKYKICNALHENSFAPKIKNSSPCAAARSGTQSFKNQAAKKRRAHTMYVCPKFSALHSKTKRPPHGKRTIPCIHWSKANCATLQVTHVAQPKTDQSTTLVRFEHVPRSRRGVRLRR